MNDLNWLDDVPELENTPNVSKNPFKKIEDSFEIIEGSTQLPSKKQAKELKENISEAIEEVKGLVTSDEDTFEDKNYIQEKLKSTIFRVESMLEQMEAGMMIGSEPRMYEVYSTMIKSLNDSIEKLMSLHKQVSTIAPRVAKDNGIVLEEKKTISMGSSDFNSLLEKLRS